MKKTPGSSDLSCFSRIRQFKKSVSVHQQNEAAAESIWKEIEQMLERDQNKKGRYEHKKFFRDES